MERLPFIVTNEGIILNIHVQPRASRNKILGEYGGSLKVALSAPPVEGAANQACIVLLAKWLGVKKAQVFIKSGKKSKNKKVLLKDVKQNLVEEKMKEIQSNG